MLTKRADFNQCSYSVETGLAPSSGIYVTPSFPEITNPERLLPATSPNLLPSIIPPLSAGGACSLSSPSSASPAPLRATPTPKASQRSLRTLRESKPVQTEHAPSLPQRKTLNDEQRQLVIAHLDFARNLVNSINFSNLDPDDLYQDAYLAMCRAALTYKARNGAKFSTYIQWPIIGAVKRGIALLRGRETVSIDDDLNDDTYSTLIEPSDSAWERMDDVEYVRELIWKLSKRDGDIIEYLYGINGRPELSVPEIAALFGKTEHYIYKVLGDIMDQLENMAHKSPSPSKKRAKLCKYRKYAKN